MVVNSVETDVGESRIAPGWYGQHVVVALANGVGADPPGGRRVRAGTHHGRLGRKLRLHRMGRSRTWSIVT